MVNNRCELWQRANYGQHGKVVNQHGIVHEYLGIPETLKSTDNAMMPADDGYSMKVWEGNYQWNVQKHTSHDGC